MLKVVSETPQTYDATNFCHVEIRTNLLVAK